jgi:hypothetical protein
MNTLRLLEPTYAQYTDQHRTMLNQFVSKANRLILFENKI